MFEDLERLNALRRARLLETTTEEQFDRLTRAAALSLAAPAAFLSIVDSGSDFYKSFYGFSGELAQTRRLEGETFCHHALIGDGLLIIEDTYAKAVYHAVPSVTTMGIRAYLGIPLHTPDHYVVGAFCVIDMKPRRWTEFDLTTACMLARAALREIELRYPRSSSSTRAIAPSLSAREREVMLRIVSGQRPKQIAADLGLSDKTVSTHRSRLLRKLGLTDNRGLYRYALENRLLDWTGSRDGHVEELRKLG